MGKLNKKWYQSNKYRCKVASQPRDSVYLKLQLYWLRSLFQRINEKLNPPFYRPSDVTHSWTSSLSIGLTGLFSCLSGLSCLSTKESDVCLYTLWTISWIYDWSRPNQLIWSPENCWMAPWKCLFSWKIFHLIRIHVRLMKLLNNSFPSMLRNRWYFWGGGLSENEPSKKELQVYARKNKGRWRKFTEQRGIN